MFRSFLSLLFVLCAALGLCLPVASYSGIIVWNPGHVGIVHNGANVANAYITGVTYTPCGASSSYDATGETEELIAGMELNSPTTDLCELELHTADVRVQGVNSHGAYVIEIPASEFILEDEDPKVLDYSVILGQVDDAPELHSW